MIRDGIKLKNNVLERLPDLIQAVNQHSDVVALYSFGSVAKKELKPLSDLDFAILLSGQLNRQQRFKKHLDGTGVNIYPFKSNNYLSRAMRNKFNEQKTIKNNFRLF